MRLIEPFVRWGLEKRLPKRNKGLVLMLAVWALLYALSALLILLLASEGYGK